MKYKLIYLLITFLSLGTFISCSKDFFDKPPLVDNVIENFYKTGNDAILAVNAAYVPLEWEFSKTYFSEWMLGDIVSDDALKGGNGITDMNDLFQLENFSASASNELLLDFYRAQYQGIYRANLVITKVPDIPVDDSVMNVRMKNRLIAEAKFLRALYYFRLVRVFGGVPKVTKILNPSEYKQPRALRDTIYNLIYTDLLSAIPDLWLKSEYPLADLGRTTKGAAQALLMKAYMYNQKWSEEIGRAHV
jgi:starch-binding outer membrane protein, SusD/RagB family